MKRTLAIIEAAMREHPNACIAYSGGGDSTALLDIIYTRTVHRPPIVAGPYCLQYPETRTFNETTAGRYGATILHAPEPPMQPAEQWDRHGWPMLGKLAARIWEKRHGGRPMGFKLDVSTCCRKQKILPVRRFTKSSGFTLQFTGQRGAQDDRLRASRAVWDGAIYRVKTDDLWVANPLIGWTDAMIRRYSRQNKLPVHPAKDRGATTIGCMYCGGGAQFTNSGFRVLRKTQPEAWRRLMVTWRAGEIVLAIKYDQPRQRVRLALEEMGGLAAVARTRPWLFDFLTDAPRPGYDKTA